MGTKYKVKITSMAFNDLREIFSYISSTLSAEEAAKNLMKNIDDAITSLNEMPHCHNLSLDQTLREKGYRRAVVKNYVILFLIDEKEKTVTVARAFHGKMDYAKYI